MLISNRCTPISDNCNDGGVRTKIYECVPNSRTGKPCIYNNRPTFDTRVETEHCNVRCFSSRWVKIDSKCIEGNNVDIYKCEKKDDKGVNDCSTMEKIPFNNGYINRYVIKPVGSEKTVITKIGGCNQELRGNWIYTTESGRLLNGVDDNYHLSKRCKTGYESFDHLIEGTYNLIPSCPSEYGCIGDSPPILTQPCRKYLPTENRYVEIYVDGKAIALSELDVPSTDLVLGGVPLKIFIAPRKKISNVEIEAVLGTIPNGWIVKEKDTLKWVSASDGPGKPGLNSSQATLFKIIIDNNGYITIRNTSIVNAKVVYHDISEII